MRPVTVRIACVQLAARPVGEADEALADAVGGIAAGAAHGAHVVVLPECTYPGYVLLRRTVPGGRAALERALRSVAEAARRAGVAVCIGSARYDAHGRLRNEATYFDRRGDEVARYAKMYLWNFDRLWFTAGTEIAPFDTEFGRLGMMICADGRMPEIARTLAERGAWLVLDPTAWVAFGETYDRMRNPQVDFMMSVRARENRMWIAAADKCGSEHDAVHYVGRSMIVAPDGFVAASADGHSPAVVVADVERGRRRPFVVHLSAAERRTLRTLRPRTARGRAPSFRLGVLQGPSGRGRREAVAALRAQGVDAIVETTPSSGALRAALHRVPGLQAAVIEGKRMMAPEPARAAALAGADVVVWSRPPRDGGVRDVARTRALESRIYVVVCCRAGDERGSCVVDPNGTIAGEALAGASSGFVAAIDTALARDKTVVPGTDAFAARVVRAFAFDASVDP